MEAVLHTADGEGLSPGGGGCFLKQKFSHWNTTICKLLEKCAWEDSWLERSLLLVTGLPGTRRCHAGWLSTGSRWRDWRIPEEESHAQVSERGHRSRLEEESPLGPRTAGSPPHVPSHPLPWNKSRHRLQDQGEA